MKMKVVVLVSGGMDSVSALYDANQSHQIIGALSFDYGSKHNHTEIPFAAWHCQRLVIPHRVIKLDFVGQFFKSDLLQSGGTIPDGHYQEQAARPRTPKTLSRTIQALFQKKLTDDELQGLLDELSKRGVVNVSDGKLSYELPQDS